MECSNYYVCKGCSYTIPSVFLFVTTTTTIMTVWSNFILCCLAHLDTYVTCIFRPICFITSFILPLLSLFYQVRNDEALVSYQLLYDIIEFFFFFGDWINNDVPFLRLWISCVFRVVKTSFCWHPLFFSFVHWQALSSFLYPCDMQHFVVVTMDKLLASCS